MIFICSLVLVIILKNEECVYYIDNEVYARQRERELERGREVVDKQLQQHLLYINLS